MPSLPSSSGVDHSAYVLASSGLRKRELAHITALYFEDEELSARRGAGVPTPCAVQLGLCTCYCVSTEDRSIVIQFELQSVASIEIIKEAVVVSFVAGKGDPVRIMVGESSTRRTMAKCFGLRCEHAAVALPSEDPEVTAEDRPPPAVFSLREKTGQYFPEFHSPPRPSPRRPPDHPPPAPPAPPPGATTPRKTEDTPKRLATPVGDPPSNPISPGTTMIPDSTLLSATMMMDTMRPQHADRPPTPFRGTAPLKAAISVLDQLAEINGPPSSPARSIRGVDVLYAPPSITPTSASSERHRITAYPDAFRRRGPYHDTGSSYLSEFFSMTDPYKKQDEVASPTSEVADIQLLAENRRLRDDLTEAVNTAAQLEKKLEMQENDFLRFQRAVLPVAGGLSSATISPRGMSVQSLANSPRSGATSHKGAREKEPVVLPPGPLESINVESLIKPNPHPDPTLTRDAKVLPHTTRRVAARATAPPPPATQPGGRAVPLPSTAPPPPPPPPPVPPTAERTAS